MKSYQIENIYYVRLIIGKFPPSLFRLLMAYYASVYALFQFCMIGLILYAIINIISFTM